MHNNNIPRRIPVICLVFFLSGCSALVFETVWFQVASRVLGSSIWSATAVLTAFMSGLAIGNVGMARFGHRIRDSFRFYVGVELVIGFTGVAAVWLLPKLSPAVGGIVASFSPGPGLLNAARFFIALIVLLIPAIAMGTTLPLLQRVVHHRDQSFASSMGILYGWNTFGAVAGVLLAEFFLIKQIGLKATSLVACFLNFAAALIILKRFGREVHVSEAFETEHDNRSISYKQLSLLAPPFLTGLVLLALEIVWFRYLLLAHATTSITFSIMLATVLAGIAIGGIAISRMSGRSVSDRKGLLATLCMAAAFFTLASFALYGLFYEKFIFQVMLFDRYFWLGALILMMPACILSGIMFPLFGESIYQNNSGVTYSAGAITLANTAGAAAGSALASFILLPWLGIERSIIALSALYLITGAWLWKANKSGSRPAGKIVRLALVGGFCALVYFTSGTIQRNYSVFSRKAVGEWELAAFREGLNETIGYFAKKVMGRPLLYRLITNSHSMSGTLVSHKRYMKLYVYFPYVLGRPPASVLQISYGVGNTAEAVVRLDSVKHYDVVDLSPDILELSHIASDVSGIYPLRDPRTRLHVEDGRFFLQTTRNQYDLITAEPPPPKNAGIVNLYSQEYFQLIRDHLSPTGMVTYWLPVHSLSDQDSLAIISAFCEVFSDCSLWNGAGLDFMLVGSQSGISFADDRTLQQGWNSVIAEDLAAIGFRKPSQLAATFLGGPDFLNGLIHDVAPVTDDFPKRISPDSSDVDSHSRLYAMLLNVERRKALLEGNSYLRRLVPATVVDEAVHSLRDESVLTSLWSAQYASDMQVESFSEELYVALQDPDRKFTAMLMLDTSPDELRLLSMVSESEKNLPEYRALLARSLLLEGSYREAADMFLALMLEQPGPGKAHYDFCQNYLIALALQGANKGARLDLVPQDHRTRIWYESRFLERASR